MFTTPPSDTKRPLQIEKPCMEGAVKKGIEAEAARVLIRSSRERNEVTVVRLNTKKVRH